MFSNTDETSLLYECKKNINVILNSRPNDKKTLNLLLQVNMAEKNWSECLTILDRISGKIVIASSDKSGKGKRKASKSSVTDGDKQNRKNVTNPYVEYQKGVIYENMDKIEPALKAFESAVIEWQKSANAIGFSNYFNPRPNDSKALQKIQMRCESHQNDENWKHLCQSVFQLGTTP